MQLTSERKDEILQKIVDRILTGLENGNLTEEELKPIADFVLGRIDEFQTEDELIPFLLELAQKWSVFSNIHIQEKGEIIANKETQASQDVLDLAKSGKLDEALNLAKRVTAQQSEKQ